MSEQLPEQESLYDNCNGCDEDYDLTPQNAGAVRYTKQPECNYIVGKCPHCDTITRMFLNEDSETMDVAEANGLMIVEAEYPDDDIYKSWLELQGITLIEPVGITHRHEEILKTFGAALMNIPDELFWDNIEAETEKPYPLRWI